jgi:hypothetical protein
VNDSPIKPKEVAMEPAEDAHDLLEAKQKGNYRITTIFKVEIDIIANISASLMGQAGIFVKMSIEAFRTDVIVFIGDVMCFTSD